jgi:hypothetical protein
MKKRAINFSKDMFRKKGTKSPYFKRRKVKLAKF